MNTIGFLQDKSLQNTIQDPIVPQTFRHSISFGETGSGKTTGFIYPNLLNRIGAGHGVLVYDFKGKEHLAVKAIAYSQNRLADVIQIGQPYSSSVNIVDYLTEANVEKVFDQLFADDEWWGPAATSIAFSVYKLLKIVNKIKIEAQKHDIELKFNYDINFARNGVFTVEQSNDEKKYNFDQQVSFKNIFDIFAKLENFACFTDGLSLFISNFGQKIYDNYKSNISQAVSLINLYAEINKEYTAIDTYRNINIKPEANKKSSGHYGVLMIIQNALKALASKEYLNSSDNNIDIIESLKNNKIIVIDTSTFSTQMLNTLTDSIFQNLCRRASDPREKNGISVFIDEAQRVMSENTDIPIDTLREARVDVFFASQSPVLMLKSLGEKNWFSLLTNITQQYNFRNNEEYAFLEDHCYMYLENEYKSDPIFFKQEHLNKVELLYQNMNKIQEKYSLNTTEIIIFDTHEFERENKLDVFDVKKNLYRKIDIYEYLDKKTTEENLVNFLKVYGDPDMSFLDEFKDKDKEKDELDEFIKMMEENRKDSSLHSILTD
jgi:hypothetical protein